MSKVCFHKLSSVSLVCLVCSRVGTFAFFFLVWRRKLWFPGGGIKHYTSSFFSLKKKKKESASAFDATLPRHVLPLPKRLVVRDNCFSLYNHKLPRNHGLSCDTAMLPLHTYTHIMWIHALAHVITITLQFFFSSPLLVMLSETVYLFPHLFLVTRQHRKVCKCLCVCVLEKKKKKQLNLFVNKEKVF